MAKKATPKKAAPAPKNEDDALFDDFVGSAAVQKKETKSKKQREIIRLTGQEGDKFNAFAKAKVVFDQVKSHEAYAKDELMPLLLNRTLSRMIGAKSRTDNPEIQTEEGRAVFVVVDTYNLDQKPGEEGKVPSTLEVFETAGIPGPVAEELADLFVTKPVLEIKPISKIRDEKPALGAKIMKLLKGLDEGEAEQIAEVLRDNDLSELADKVDSLIGLDGDERREVLLTRTEVTAKGGEKPGVVLDKMVRICENAGQLETAFKAAKVEFRITGVTYSGDLAEAAQQLAHKDVPVKEKQTEYFSSDRKYRFTYQGKTAYIHKADDPAAPPVVVKECDNPGHAVNSVKLWSRNPAKLQEALANA